MKNILFYKKKASAWEEALPVGNGRLGAMVFGNLKTERIALNEDTLWSGYPKDLNKKDASEHLDEIRKAIFDGNELSPLARHIKRHCGCAKLKG